MTKQVITTSDVAIKQVEVSIKVLKIGNKQVTQAVFKQLLEEPLIHPDTGELQGNAWGRVNYHVGCEQENEHLHVVWQKGDELRRAKVYKNVHSDLDRKLLREMDAFVKAFIIARILEGWTPETTTGPGMPALPSRYTFDLLGWTVTAYLEQDICNAWWYYASGQVQIAHKDKLEARLASLNVPCDSYKIAREYWFPLAEKRSVLANAWQQSYDHLQLLEQLFIAV